LWGFILLFLINKKDEVLRGNKGFTIHDVVDPGLLPEKKKGGWGGGRGEYCIL
jgi:hypothetical protein